MFTPKHIKEGKMLLKGVEKFVHYKRDILAPAKLDEIQTAAKEFAVTVKSREKEAIQAKSKDLQRLCEKSVAQPPHSMMRENVEVFFVAIVIALGIRAYFLQPFKIPTGSMQPTLNGYIGYPLEQEAEAKPNFLKQGWDLAWKGRSYVNEVAEVDFRVTNMYQKDHLRFFPVTYIERKGLRDEKLSPLRIWSPVNQVVEDLGLGARLGLGRGSFTAEGQPRSPVGGTFQKGEVIVRGYVETGDQVLVNKFSYHFRKPSRGEVFVFSTKGIAGIEKPGQPSQHYIKRLAAVPGDSWEVKEPEVWINGQRATHPVMNQIMDMSGKYEGRSGYNGRFSGRLSEKQYLALGDNSANSLDSRAWGHVPEKNLVGPALCAYFPFGNHFGLIH